MNKNLKKIIAITMAIGIISAAGPAGRINLLTSKAYASDNSTNTLSSLGLETSGGSTVNIYSDSSYSNAVSSTSISPGITYYAQSSSKTVRVNISGPASEYVKVFNDTSSSTEGKSVSSNISISSGTTTLVVRVYDTEPSSNIKYSSDSHVVSEYRIKVKYSNSSSSDNEDELDSLKLENSSGDTINLYNDDDYDSDNKVDSEDVDSGTDYYAKTSSNTVQVHISGVSSKYVRIFKGKGDDEDDISDSAKGKETGDDISLSSGTNVLVVRVYNDEPDDDVEYDDDDDVECDYTIYVDCTGDGSSDSDSSDDDNADDYDDIYLDSLSIDGNSISLSDSKVTYTYNAASDADEVTIKAKPEDEDEDTVEIDGDEVDDGDNYKKDVDLNNGENDIKVKIEDEDDNKREYTLKIYRGSSSTDSSSTAGSNATTTNTASSTSDAATTVSTGNAAATTTTATKSGWVQASGKWQYYDNQGKQLINQWVFDKNYSSWYYMGSDGFMVENSWILSSGKYYYLNTSGAMAANCWVISGGKYYYLSSDGSMATNTTISGYKVGADGAWIS
ncbi:cadherin-like beta sandwich domain-containing protein [Clostridium sp. BL-8]|uniref:cadherin-like beta sandwich domain-containing protein n=1 Tax=Clostridium sp. BL-8 TaxID=349938 RepID=UPI00098C4955|nr:cadherin-like beta sandwich domain-containing protein [Clostridium sp. BL-8]OOM71288.1 putative endo-beta-N-acetylglucosaminidase precursor [Clostridium sp. BL-8]